MAAIWLISNNSYLLCYGATSSCIRLVQSIIYNLHKGTMGFVVTWQELWMLVGLGLGWSVLGLGKGKGAHLKQSWCT